MPELATTTLTVVAPITSAGPADGTGIGIVTGDLHFVLIPPFYVTPYVLCLFGYDHGIPPLSVCCSVFNGLSGGYMQSL